MHTPYLKYLMFSLTVWFIGVVGGAFLGAFFSNPSDWCGIGYFLGLLFCYVPACLISYIFMLRAIGVKKTIKYWIIAIAAGLFVSLPLYAVAVFVAEQIWIILD